MAAVLKCTGSSSSVSIKGRPMTVPIIGSDYTDGNYDRANPSPSPNTSSSQQASTIDFLKLDLRKESDRLKTLQYWPCGRFLSSVDAARSGLYYVGRDDTLKCYFCKVELNHWQKDDVIEDDHAKWSQECPLLLKKATGNVPMSRDECGIMEPRDFRPAHVRYMTEASRLTSFKFWPTTIRQKPEDLANAGFYYSGTGDQAICYYCGGGLKDWEEDDDPWEQHALWFSKCPYVINLKGVDFIKQVQAKLSSSSSDNSSAPQPEKPPAVARPQVDSKNQQQTSSSSELPQESSSGNTENKQCSICYDSERNVCFVPCGHVVACIKCAMSLCSCPVCRQPYTKLVKLYFS